MAEPLKSYLNERVVTTIARMIADVWGRFDSKAFVADATSGLEDLALMDRGRHMASALRRHLPRDYTKAAGILVKSVAAPPERKEGDGGMTSFLYLPHVSFVAQFGLEEPVASLAALHALTQRFTAEFAIRPFIEQHEARTLRQLDEWVTDPSEHVRRLVSEGTRPRLPWAGRLRRFQMDPGPVLALLERLKDDPSEYVRRSVANNLNDIGRDHPDLLLETARCWMKDASETRRRLLRHALRTELKKGTGAALAVMGYSGNARMEVERASIVPSRVVLGSRVVVTCDVRNPTRRTQKVLVDLRVHFVRSSGRHLIKVFRVTAAELAPSALLTCRKTISLAMLTTRRHYPGRHMVELLVNGRLFPIGHFVAVPEPRERTT